MLTTFQAGDTPDAATLEEGRKKLRTYIQDKLLFQNTTFFFKTFLSVHKVVEQFKIVDDMDSKIDNFGERERLAAIKIQKRYRRRKMFELVAVEKKREDDKVNQESTSILLANSIQGKSFSLYSPVYRRFCMTDDDLRKQSNDSYLYLKTIPKMAFSSTLLEARVYIFYNKNDQNNKCIDLELIFPITGMLQHLSIKCDDISPHFKKALFMKKMDEMLLDNLEYDKKYRKVIFLKDNKKVKKHLNIKTNVHIQSYIKAKMMRLRFLRQKKEKIKELHLIKMDNYKLDRLYVGIKFYLDPIKKQIRLQYSRVDEGVIAREVYIRFEKLSEKSHLKAIIFDSTASVESTLSKLEPYMGYLSKIVRIGSSRDEPAGFKIFVDDNAFTIEYADSKSMSLYIKDISSDVEAEIISRNPRGMNMLLARKKTKKYVDPLKLNQVIEDNAIIESSKDVNEATEKIEITQVIDKTPEPKIEMLDKSISSEDIERAEIEKPMKVLTKKELERAAKMIQRMYRGRLQKLKYNFFKSRKTNC